MIVLVTYEDRKGPMPIHFIVGQCLMSGKSRRKKNSLCPMEKTSLFRYTEIALALTFFVAAYDQSQTR